MSNYIDDKFMLHSSTAISLYEKFAKNAPIIDYHCHLEAQEIFEDISFTNLTELWLKYDHYKWRLMRAAGIEEKYITGDSSDKDKFIKWCEVCGKAIGNPLCHWSNLELKRYFNINKPINAANAIDIWYESLEILKDGHITARQLIKDSNVKLICTTNEPIDPLLYHGAIANDSDFDVKVLPTLRLDNIFDLGREGYYTYISELSQACGFIVKDFDTLVKALKNRIQFFADNGCILADHGMTQIHFDTDYTINEADVAFKRRLNNYKVSEDEITAFKTQLTIAVCREYAMRGWTLQLHFSCLRNNNTLLFNQLGANAGCDSIAAGFDFLTPLSAMIDYLNTNSILPRLIIYSLNPNDNALIDTLIGSFQEHISTPGMGAGFDSVSGLNDELMQEAYDIIESSENIAPTNLPKLIHGAAWWFNDSFEGIRSHLKTTAEQGYLPGFIGMLTDSRSFLSYTRHDYFRRILCDLLGDYVESGMFPNDEEILGSIVADISYNNAASLFERSL